MMISLLPLSYFNTRQITQAVYRKKNDSCLHIRTTLTPTVVYPTHTYHDEAFVYRLYLGGLYRIYTTECRRHEVVYTIETVVYTIETVVYTIETVVYTIETVVQTIETVV